MVLRVGRDLTRASCPPPPRAGAVVSPSRAPRPRPVLTCASASSRGGGGGRGAGLRTGKRLVRAGPRAPGGPHAPAGQRPGVRGPRPTHLSAAGPPQPGSSCASSSSCSTSWRCGQARAGGGSASPRPGPRSCTQEPAGGGAQHRLHAAQDPRQPGRGPHARSPYPPPPPPPVPPPRTEQRLIVVRAGHGPVCTPRQPRPARAACSRPCKHPTPARPGPALQGATAAAPAGPRRGPALRVALLSGERGCVQIRTQEPTRADPPPRAGAAPGSVQVPTSVPPRAAAAAHLPPTTIPIPTEGGGCPVAAGGLFPHRAPRPRGGWGAESAAGPSRRHRGRSRVAVAVARGAGRALGGPSRRHADAVGTPVSGSQWPVAPRVSPRTSCRRSSQEVTLSASVPPRARAARSINTLTQPGSPPPPTSWAGGGGRLGPTPAGLALTAWRGHIAPACVPAGTGAAALGTSQTASRPAGGGSMVTKRPGPSTVLPPHSWHL